MIPWIGNDTDRTGIVWKEAYKGDYRISCGNEAADATFTDNDEMVIRLVNASA